MPDSILLLALLLQAQVSAPPVEEPLLAPPPPAAELVQTWPQALARLEGRSPDLAQALSRVERAEAESGLAVARLLPVITTTLSVQQNLVERTGGTLVEGGDGPINVGTTLDGATLTTPFGLLRGYAGVPLVDVRAWRGFSAARAQVRASQAALLDVRRQTLQALARTLLAATGAERVAELDRAGLRDALERHRLTSEAERLGAGSRLDTLRTARDLEAARAEVLAATEALLRSREALGLALGSAEPVGVAPGFSLEGLQTSATGACRPLRGEARPDVASAEAQVARAEDDVGSARAAYLPTLGAQSTATAVTVNPGFAQAITWNVALVLRLPLWDGGARAAQIRLAESQLHGARSALASAAQQARVEVARARRAVAVAEGLHQSSRRGREAAEEADRLTRQRFAGGSGTSLELVDSAGGKRAAERALALREIQLVEARIDAVLAEAICLP